MDSFILAAVIAAGFVLLTGPFFIPELHKLKFGQSIREEGPASHQAKSGTPTMGGIMIILGITIATLVAAPFSTEILLALFIMLGHFVLGFLDDYIKVVKKRNLGLKAKQKMLGQIIIAVVTMVIGTRMLGIDTTIWLPVLDSHINIGVGYYALVLFVMVGTSNAVNLTDGLDGLASGTVAIAASSYAVVCTLLGTAIWLFLLRLWLLPAWASCASMHIRPRCLWAIQVLWRWAVPWRRWASSPIRKCCWRLSASCLSVRRCRSSFRWLPSSLRASGCSA